MTKDMSILGARSTPKYSHSQNITILMKSTNNCLGHVDTKDYNYPVCIEDLVGMRCIDVGCGENFTVVISSEKMNKLSYYNMKEFYSGILENAKEKVNKIQKLFTTKMPKTIKPI